VRRWLDDPDSMLEIITSSNYSPNYRRNLVACVKSWAKFVDDRELRVQLEDIKSPAPVPRDVREPFSRDEWFELIDAIDSADYISGAQKHTCALIAIRGIRCGDVLRLTKRDVSQGLKTGILAFESKGERWQKFSAAPLRDHLEGLLEDWRKKAPRVRNLVAPGSAESSAQATASRAIRYAFDRIAKELGIDPQDLYAHRFRHTYATLFLQTMAGDPEALPKLQQQMGWARLDTASNYLRRSRREELDELESKLFERER
jgi:integrase